jgi:glycerophosphoryl diester phosphodiesterase
MSHARNAGYSRALRALAALTLTVWAAGVVHAATVERVAAIRAKLIDPRAGVFVIAHRGCHNPDPAGTIPVAPENSIAALQNCLVLGVDMMETDVRRSRDGALVIMHDETVDRTTDGSGRVGNLSLSELKALHLRQNFGGAMSPTLTDLRVLTLEELLAAARGRIMLNLDIKEAIYPQVIAAVARAGMADQVLVKSVIDTIEPPLADQTPYDQVLYMPIIQGTATHDLAAVLAAQTEGRRRIPAAEMIYLDQGQFQDVRRAAQRAGIRLWANTLTSVGVISVIGMGGDEDALRDPSTWRRLLSNGITMIQTDEPGVLENYLRAVASLRHATAALRAGHMP